MLMRPFSFLPHTAVFPFKSWHIFPAVWCFCLVVCLPHWTDAHWVLSLYQFFLEQGKTANSGLWRCDGEGTLNVCNDNSTLDWSAPTTNSSTVQSSTAPSGRSVPSALLPKLGSQRDVTACRPRHSPIQPSAQSIPKPQLKFHSNAYWFRENISPPSSGCNTKISKKPG
jgi:hypothetical protein